MALPNVATAHEVVPPRALVQVAPEWPGARPYAHDIVVPVVLTVTADGAVADVQLEAAVGAGFDDEAIRVVKTWTFRPAVSDGKPVAAKIRAIVRFVGKTGAPPRSAERAPPNERAAPPSNDVHRAPPNVRAAPSNERAAPPSNDVHRAPPSSVERAAPSPGTQRGAEAEGDFRALPDIDVEVQGERASVPRSASETRRGQEIIRAAPHRTGGDVLQVVPGIFITQHSGQGKAYQIFYRGFDAVHGQDLEFWVGGAPVNDVSNIHGQGYADLHFVMPEVVARVTALPGNYSPAQGDFAVAGTIRYDLGLTEPGFVGKATSGSFGERRVFLGYRPEDAPSGSFAAFEAQSTDGFGPARAAERSSAMAQQILRVGEGQLRLNASAYSGRFASPGVVRWSDLEDGTLSRFATYGGDQGGYSSRYQFVADYSAGADGSDWHFAPFFVRRGLQLKQNYTGYLLNEGAGDTTQLVNDATTLGLTGHYRRRLHWLSKRDTIESGVFLRSDWIEQSQAALSADALVLATAAKADVRASNMAAWVDLGVSPAERLRLDAGMRVDGLAYYVRDQVSTQDAGGTPEPSPQSPGTVRTAMGSHFGPRLTTDVRVGSGAHVLLAYGEGFRSPQARSLGHGERTPFTTVRSMEAGIRYAASRLVGSAAVFRTTLANDLVFDTSTARNETAPASARHGLALEFITKPAAWFVSSGSGTYTQARFSETDATFRKGDKLPYVPEFVVRQDLAFTPELGRLWSRRLVARVGTALTGMFNRPQPYGSHGHNVFLVDASIELRLKEVALGVDVFNLFDARWLDSEFTYSANFTPGAAPRLVPERYVTVGAPRTSLATLSLYIE